MAHLAGRDGAPTTRAYLGVSFTQSDTGDRVAMLRGRDYRDVVTEDAPGYLDSPLHPVAPSCTPTRVTPNPISQPKP